MLTVSTLLYSHREELESLPDLVRTVLDKAVAKELRAIGEPTETAGVGVGDRLR